MKRRIFAAGLLLSLLITCVFSACASGGASSGPSGGAPAASTSASETSSAAPSTSAAPAASTGETPAAAVPENSAENGAPVLWSAKEMPVSLKYDRMWVYSAHAETEDAAILGKIVDAVKNLSVGEKADYVVDDFTDLLLFTFPDGSTYRLEFEEENWVTEGSGRLHVEGLSQLRALLDKLLGDQIQK